MASKAPIAYVPLNKTIPNVDQAPKKIDTPDYPDPGVSFAGFAKRLYSGNSYQIIRQSHQNVSALYTFVGATTGVSVTRNDINTKDFYCTGIWISVNRAAAVGNDAFRIWDGTSSSGRLRFITREEGGGGLNWTFFVDLKTPIKFSKGNVITFSFSANRAIGDTISFNLFGWEEESSN